jgi:hypothetical protein
VNRGEQHVDRYSGLRLALNRGERREISPDQQRASIHEGLDAQAANWKLGLAAPIFAEL